MSKKDFDREFLQIEAQYLDMIQELKDMENEMKNDLVAPETYDQMKKMIEPILVNYNTWNYIKFILNKPVKKEKEKKYQNQNKKLLDHVKTLEQSKAENQEVLNNLKELV